MKRLTSLFLALVMCMSFAAFTASAEGYEIVYDGTAFAPITSEPVTLKVLTYAAGTSLIDYSTMTWFHEALKPTNVTLDVELVVNSMYNEVYRTRMAGGVDLPDIICVAGGDQDGTYADAGLFVKLNEYAEKYGFNQAKLLERYPVAKGSMTHFDGTQYFMPYTLLATEHARQLNYNVKLFEANGLDVPETTDELLETLRALKELGDWNENGKADEVPLFARSINFVMQLGSFWGLDLANVGFTADEDGVVTCNYVDEKYKDYLHYVKTLLDEGLLNADCTSSSWDLQQSAWTTNSIGIIFDWVSNVSDHERALDPTYNYFTDERLVAVMGTIEGPFGDDIYFGRPPVGNVFAVTRACDKPDVAYCVMDYLLNQDVVDMTWLGLEGIDYTKDEAGNITFTETYIADKDNYRSIQGYNAEMLPGGQSLFGYGLATNHPDNVAQWAVNAEKTVLPISFAFLPAEYNDTINTYQADFKTYVEEALVNFVYGNRDIDAEWDAYVAECYSLGLEELTEVYQARYDASK